MNQAHQRGPGERNDAVEEQRAASPSRSPPLPPPPPPPPPPFPPPGRVRGQPTDRTRRDDSNVGVATTARSSSLMMTVSVTDYADAHTHKHTHTHTHTQTQTMQACMPRRCARAPSVSAARCCVGQTQKENRGAFEERRLRAEQRRDVT